MKTISDNSRPSQASKLSDIYHAELFWHISITTAYKCDNPEIVILPLEGILDTQGGVVWKAYTRKCFASVDAKAVLEEGRRDHYLTPFDQSNVICCLYFTVQSLNVTE